jgi:hypothetical protein
MDLCRHPWDLHRRPGARPYAQVRLSWGLDAVPAGNTTAKAPVSAKPWQQDGGAPRSIGAETILGGDGAEDTRRSGERRAVSGGDQVRRRTRSSGREALTYAEEAGSPVRGEGKMRCRG